MQLYVRVHRAPTKFLSTTTLSPSVTMRSTSEVDAAIEAACAGDSHGAQTPVSAIGRGRWGRRRRVQARTAAASRSALHTVSTKSHGFEPITRGTGLAFTAVQYCTVTVRISEKYRIPGPDKVADSRTASIPRTERNEIRLPAVIGCGHTAHATCSRPAGWTRRV